MHVPHTLCKRSVSDIIYAFMILFVSLFELLHVFHLYDSQPILIDFFSFGVGKILAFNHQNHSTFYIPQEYALKFPMILLSKYKHPLYNLTIILEPVE